jgi:hypothetical protein
VSTNFSDVLGVPVARGRGFLPEEERRGSDRVVVISDGLFLARIIDQSALGARRLGGRRAATAPAIISQLVSRR